MQALSEKFMSDEETDEEDCNSFVKRALTWRSEKLNELIKKLDHRYMSSREKKDRSKPLKVRKLSLPSERLPPLCAPKWAINATDNIDMNAPVSLDLSSQIENSESLSDSSVSPALSITSDSPRLSITSNSPTVSINSDSPSLSITSNSPDPNISDFSDIDSDPELDSWISSITGVVSK